MKPKLVLTSFQTWLPHQKSNSSDDLLNLIQKQQFNSVSLSFLRQLPVNVERASQKAIAAMQKIQPHGVICCGMAESRRHLTIESRAFYQADCLTTKVNLEELVQRLLFTTISHDAGKFVCEGLYYQVLKYIQVAENSLPCIFVHVPLLTQSNLDIVKKDFQAIVKFMAKIATEIKDN